MDDPTVQAAFATAKKYSGQSLADWLAKWMTMKSSDLERVNSQFLKLMATWVFRKFSARRKGGVPMGFLGKFILPENQTIDFTGALAAQVISILRKRGLLEADTQSTDGFRRLLDAFDRSPKISEPK